MLINEIRSDVEEKQITKSDIVVTYFVDGDAIGAYRLS